MHISELQMLFGSGSYLANTGFPDLSFTLLKICGVSELLTLGLTFIPDRGDRLCFLEGRGDLSSSTVIFNPDEYELSV